MLVNGLLASLLACPRCRSRGITLSPDPSCPDCGFNGRTSGSVPDFIEESWLHEGHHEEVAAQTAAVDSYYENELRLTCHWDRISAADLFEMLGSPSGVALDLGCGTGTAGGGLVRSGTKVIGADLSLPCLEVARRRLDAVVRVDAAHLPFRDAAFDAVVSRGALHHMDAPDQVLIETRRVLKPGARALFMDPREYAWLEPIKHALRRDDDSFTHAHHAFDMADYEKLIGQHLEVEKVVTLHPFGVLIAHGLDLLPLPRAIPRRPLAKGLLALDKRLEQTPLGRYGHLLVVVAKRPLG